MNMKRDLLLRDVRVAHAMGASADACIWQETAVVEGVGARLFWQADLLDDLEGTAEFLPCKFSY